MLVKADLIFDRARGFGWAVGFLLLWCLVVCVVGCLFLFCLLFVSWFECAGGWCVGGLELFHASWASVCWRLGLRLASVNVFEPAGGFLLTVSGRCFFCGYFLLFIFRVCLYYIVLSVPCSILITCWERDDLLALGRLQEGNTYC